MSRSVPRRGRRRDYPPPYKKCGILAVLLALLQVWALEAGAEGQQHQEQHLQIQEQQQNQQQQQHQQQQQQEPGRPNLLDIPAALERVMLIKGNAEDLKSPGKEVKPGAGEEWLEEENYENERVQMEEEEEDDGGYDMGARADERARAILEEMEKDGGGSLNLPPPSKAKMVQENKKPAVEAVRDSAPSENLEEIQHHAAPGQIHPMQQQQQRQQQQQQQQKHHQDFPLGERSIIDSSVFNKDSPEILVHQRAQQIIREREKEMGKDETDPETRDEFHKCYCSHRKRI